MKFMLLVYLEPGAMTASERDDCFVKSAQLANDLAASGHYVSASPLQPTDTATSVRIRDRKRLMTDGPFMETREQLGGYFLIEARDQAEANEIAGRIPAARFGTIEVRPVLEIPGLPAM